jgi:hypothetical protein
MYTLDINFLCERKTPLLLKKILGNKNIQDWYTTNILTGAINQEKVVQAIEYMYRLGELDSPEIQFVSSPFAAIDLLTQILPPQLVSILPESQFLQRWNKIFKKQLNPEILTGLTNPEIEEVLQQLVQQMVMDGFGKELILSDPEDRDQIGNSLIDEETINSLNPRLLFPILDSHILLYNIAVDPTQKLRQYLPANISIPISFAPLELEITKVLGKDINSDIWEKIWDKISNYKKRNIEYPLTFIRPEILFYIIPLEIFNYLNKDAVELNNLELQNGDDFSEDYEMDSPDSLFELFKELLSPAISQQVNKLRIATYLDNSELLAGIDENKDINTREDVLIVEQLINLVQNCGWIVPFEKLCIVCDRPTSISFDEKGRLHALGKPAFEFADGNKVFFNNGVLASKKYEPPPIRPQKKPPVSQPPVSQSPVSQPPVSQPPVSQPPEPQSPVSQSPVSQSPVSQNPVSVAPSSKSSLLTKEKDNLKKILIQSLSVADNCREIHAILLDVWEDFELVSIKTNLDAQPIHILKKISSSANKIQLQRVPSNIKSAKQAVEWVSLK